jgi:hypothetical protein
LNVGHWEPWQEASRVPLQRFAASLAPFWVGAFLRAVMCDQGSLLSREARRIEHKVLRRYPNLPTYAMAWHQEFEKAATARVRQIAFRREHVFASRIEPILRRALCSSEIAFYGMAERKFEQIPSMLGMTARFDIIAGTITNADGKAAWTDVSAEWIARRQALALDAPEPDTNHATTASDYSPSKQAREFDMREAARAVYSFAQNQGMKAPNVNEAKKAVRDVLAARGLKSTGQLAKLLDDKEFAVLRRGSGLRVNYSLAPFSMQGWSKAGSQS